MTLPRLGSVPTANGGSSLARRSTAQGQHRCTIHTTNFTSYELVAHVLHSVARTGVWECIDFYPVLNNSSVGLETSVVGPDVKHVLKASLDDLMMDYYVIGTYDLVNDTWTPDDASMDVGIGLRSIVPLDIGMATQLDIFAEFEIQGVRFLQGGCCCCRIYAKARTSYGPFGLGVLADDSLSELTLIYLRVVDNEKGRLKTYICADESR
ncbi:hypothetical protein MLD38_013329 [Melastoma candidum]|uniref:Uncharacterized protein n=1 Tax=Melastoma candidum TaxID=119954 RepID=A0ACB9R8U7_9MYRT|nr:hypothetical protein MLD38_013329 [Melastoma candidum]